MDATEFFPSKWLSAEDVGKQKIVTTINRIGTEEMQEEKKLVVFFDLIKTNKGLILNKTNFNRLKEELGSETDNWVGKYVELYTIKTDFKGKEVDAVRLKVVQAPVTSQGDLYDGGVSMELKKMLDADVEDFEEAITKDLEDLDFDLELDED